MIEDNQRPAEIGSATCGLGLNLCKKPNMRAKRYKTRGIGMCGVDSVDCNYSHCIGRQFKVFLPMGDPQNRPSCIPMWLLIQI